MRAKLLLEYGGSLVLPALGGGRAVSGGTFTDQVTDAISISVLAWPIDSGRNEGSGEARSEEHPCRLGWSVHGMERKDRQS